MRLSDEKVQLIVSRLLNQVSITVDNVTVSDGEWHRVDFLISPTTISLSVDGSSEVRSGLFDHSFSPMTVYLGGDAMNM